MTSLVFSTAAYEPLRNQLAPLLGGEVGLIEHRIFPDGEPYRRIASRAAHRDCVLVGGTVNEVDTLELYDLACGLVNDGAERVILLMPYFGHSTMERAVKVGEVVTAKTRARLLSSIPVPPRGLPLLLLDLHVEGITHYFEGAVRPFHVYAKSLMMQAARDVGGDDFVLACTDAGRAKWVESLANDMGVPCAFVYKRRVSGDQTQVTGVSANVEGKHVLIYDDMIRTGGSLISAARAYRDAGATRIDALATHGVFPGDAASKILASGLFATITVTDSHPNAKAAVAKVGNQLRVLEIAPLLAGALRAIVLP